MRLTTLLLLLAVLAGCSGKAGHDVSASPGSSPVPSAGEPSPAPTPPPAAAELGIYRSGALTCVALARAVACMTTADATTWRSPVGFQAIRLGALDMASGVPAGLFTPANGGPVIEITSGTLWTQDGAGCVYSGTLAARRTDGAYPLTVREECAGADLEGLAAWVDSGPERVLYVAASDASDAHRVAWRGVYAPPAAPPDPGPVASCPLPKPELEHRDALCPSGAGTFSQVRGYQCDTPPTWTVGEWTPSGPRSTDCQPEEPPPGGGGGGDPSPDPVPPPSAVTLTATPASIAPGGASRLDWSAPADALCAASSADTAWQGAVAPTGSTWTSPLTVSTTYSLSCRRPLEAAVVRSLTVAVVDDSPGCEATDSCGPPPLVVPYAGTWALEGAYCAIGTGGPFYCAAFSQGAHTVYEGAFTDSTHAAGSTCRAGVAGPPFAAVVSWQDGENRLRVELEPGPVIDGMARAGEWIDAPRCSPP